MEKVVLTTPAELEALIESTVRRAFRTESLAKVQTSPEQLNVKQAAAFLDLAKQTIYGFTSRNEIPHYKRGKKVYFLKAELEHWMLQNRQPVKQKSSVFRNSS